MNKLFSKRWSAQQITSAIVVAGSTLMLLMTLHPELILKNNTPTGGDMGAPCLRSCLFARFSASTLSTNRLEQRLVFGVSDVSVLYGRAGIGSLVV